MRNLRSNSCQTEKPKNNVSQTQTEPPRRAQLRIQTTNQTRTSNNQTQTIVNDQRNSYAQTETTVNHNIQTDTDDLIVEEPVTTNDVECQTDNIQINIDTERSKGTDDIKIISPRHPRDGSSTYNINIHNKEQFMNKVESEEFVKMIFEKNMLKTDIFESMASMSILKNVVRTISSMHSKETESCIYSPDSNEVMDMIEKTHTKKKSDITDLYKHSSIDNNAREVNLIHNPNYPLYNPDFAESQYTDQKLDVVRKSSFDTRSFQFSFGV